MGSKITTKIIDTGVYGVYQDSVKIGTMERASVGEWWACPTNAWCVPTNTRQQALIMMNGGIAKLAAGTAIFRKKQQIASTQRTNRAS